MGKRRSSVNPTLFDPVERLVPIGDSDLGVPGYILDIPESIPQLGYGSHQFFRYYGKFPSLVGREIISRFPPPQGSAILDCYSGSGTTLVEAQIAGYSSYGVDINPLAVMACNVKTSYFDVERLRRVTDSVVDHASRANSPWAPSKTAQGKLDKWFTQRAQDELGRLRSTIDTLPDDSYTEFVVVAFLGIVRRCSNAYDGEVRPHINPNKKPRTPIEAFRDKVDDMIGGLAELDTMRRQNIGSYTMLGDNRSPAAYDFVDADVRLLVAHPPYLNSFNYLSVYNLEFFWAEGLNMVWRGATEAQIRAAEHKAWPATESNLVAAYYEDFGGTMKTAVDRLTTGGVVAVVVGDATIRGRLEPVHRLMANSLRESGLAPIEVWYRTTHYGIGKYAYSHRADYHGDAVKKDAILFFRKLS